MKTRNLILVLLPCLAALGTSGCPRKVVSAAMPAPMPTQPLSQRQPQPDQPPPVIPPPTDSAPQAQLPSPASGSQPAPAAPEASRAPAPARSAPAEADPSKPKAPLEAPVIAPALSQRDLANAVRLTNNDQRAAQRTLLLARNRRLNPSQADLFDKVKGFLDQTEDAKKSNDWVRAQNLAHKAQVLAAELMKSL